MFESENRNILRDDSGHLKVADFGVSKLLVVQKTAKKDRPTTSLDSSCKFSYLLFLKIALSSCVCSCTELALVFCCLKQNYHQCNGCSGWVYADASLIVQGDTWLQKCTETKSMIQK